MIFLVVARHRHRHPIFTHDFPAVLGNALGPGLPNHLKALFPASTIRAQQAVTRAIAAASATKGLVPGHSLARGHVAALPLVLLAQGAHHYGTEEIAPCWFQEAV
ncbi:hypothetical protein RSOLAG1IB_01721 [Rhizoctonia solani AG-1 IB]|uniref:Uncharacterized protein n=1 Tax=Thanatephorus cucumeris (strain AG1-IB / isolate 7/3/14) TaxID=1108050 RepID=A0A0B7FFN8_THACB|nr:hypothetical protein RSOLAG1IB_01721 [Rhizoctonia solani AG-1 IB]